MNENRDYKIKKPGFDTGLIVSPLKTTYIPSSKQQAAFNLSYKHPTEPISFDSVAKFSMKSREGQNSQKPYKVNQDSYTGIRNFGNVKTMWIFGVFDGHGTNGHLASNFIKQHLPRNN